VPHLHRYPRQLIAAAITHLDNEIPDRNSYVWKIRRATSPANFLEEIAVFRTRLVLRKLANVPLGGEYAVVVSAHRIGDRFGGWRGRRAGSQVECGLESVIPTGRSC
jgi:hypothetical protein